MTPSEPFIALAPVAAAFESLGVRYYIGGSIASVQHGVPRSTMDIDVVADLGRGQVDPLIVHLGDDFFADPAAIGQAVQSRGSFNLIHLPTMFKVDVFIGQDVPFQEVIMARAKPCQPTDAGRAYPIATAEDTILSKLKWYREGGETSERQWLDVVGVIQVQGDNLDHDHLRTWSRQLNLDDLLDRVLREATE